MGPIVVIGRGGDDGVACADLTQFCIHDVGAMPWTFQPSFDHRDRIRLAACDVFGAGLCQITCSGNPITDLLALGIDMPIEILVSHAPAVVDRKSTRLNSSHANISYAVFCLKKKTKS